jgi:phosphate transport system permease protein
VILERQEYGNFHGFLRELQRDGQPLVLPAGASALVELRRLHAEIRPAILKVSGRERDEVGAINAELEEERLRVKTAERERSPRLAEITAASERRTAELKARYETLREALEKERALLSATKAVFADAAGQTKDIRSTRSCASLPNDLRLRKLGLYFAHRRVRAREPRESNTEGGTSAIFGIGDHGAAMSIVGVPLGVLTALYLREYAVQGRVVRIVRIAVNNLAGVPSIVFGIFGLGFFVYGIGSSIDKLFFSAALPSPTFGTGGILWCALTLALLTIPVVVVASEEALAAVPRGMREASLAIGATKWQTTYRVVLPAAAPGILTGLILAMARGTGEVAPLMIVGVVKLAPTLPVDSSWPFLHLERKIMHLGFHIYDVGFQSPNIEAALPMVYMTTVLLMLVIVALNLSAILIRNHLRRKLSASVF